MLLESCFWFLLAGLLSAVLTYIQVKVSRRLKLAEAPRTDRWHSCPTPTSGGVAVFLSCALIYAVSFGGHRSPVAAGAAMLWLVGLLDDRLRLRPGIKFGAQALAALWVIAHGIVFPATPWAFANAAFTFLWIVGLTNAFNLIDNMDGLCAGVVVVICVFRFWLLAAQGQWVDAQLCGVLGAAFAGFLVFNYHPAKIFMGDCGSMFAGFSLAALAIGSPLPHTKIFLAGFFYPALTFTYPIFDTVLVTVLRKAAGRPISVGGRDHSSHRLASLGLGERKVVWILWSLTALGSGLARMVEWMPLEVIAAAALLLGLVTVFGIFLGTLPAYPVPDTLPQASWIRRCIPTLRAGILLLVDALLAGLALFMAVLIRFDADPPIAQLSRFLSCLPVFLICHGVACCFERTFNVPWKWLSLFDVVALGRATVMGAAGSLLIFSLLGIPSYPHSTVAAYCLFVLMFSTALRASLRLLQAALYRSAGDHTRIAILGADSKGELLASLLDKDPSLHLRPVLILDGKRDMDGMRIRGIPVRHCDSNLKDLSTEFQFNSVIVAGSALEDQDCHRVEQQCREFGMALLALDIGIRSLVPVPAECKPE